MESQFTEYNEAVIKIFSMPAESRKDFIKPYLSRHYIDTILDEELAGSNEDDEIQIDPGNLKFNFVDIRKDTADFYVCEDNSKTRLKNLVTDKIRTDPERKMADT